MLMLSCGSRAILCNECPTETLRQSNLKACFLHVIPRKYSLPKIVVTGTTG